MSKNSSACGGPPSQTGTPSKNVREGTPSSSQELDYDEGEILEEEPGPEEQENSSFAELQRKLEHSMEEKFQAMLNKSLEAFMGKKLDESTESSSSRGESDKSVNNPVQTPGAQRLSDSGPSMNSSVESDQELAELELLKRTVEMWIQAKRNDKDLPPVPSSSVFTEIMHKARDTCNSLSVNPSSSPPSVDVVGVPGQKTTEVQIEVAKEKVTEQTTAQPVTLGPAAALEPQPGTSTGKAGTDWFDARLMQALHNIDGEDLVFEHLDRKVLEAIAKDEFVEFGRLIDRQEIEPEKGIHLYNQEGVEFYFPQNKAAPKINSFGEWCRASLVFQAAHQKFHPERTAKIMEYRASIEEFAKQFPWAKVAEYHRRFRRNMAKKPWRHWGLVNQLWRAKILVSDEEREKPKGTKDKPSDQEGGKSTKAKGKKRGICRTWNSTGDCKFGNKCHYEHKCAICGKQGHGAVHCHKLKSGSGQTGADKKQ